jgi:hypothetical protein
MACYRLFHAREIFERSGPRRLAETDELLRRTMPLTSSHRLAVIAASW